MSLGPWSHAGGMRSGYSETADLQFFINSLFPFIFQDGYTPLLMAVEAGFVEMTVLLLSRGASLNARNVRSCSHFIYPSITLNLLLSIVTIFYCLCVLLFIDE